MSFEVIATPDFVKDLKALSKRHRSIKEDIAKFSTSLEDNPFQGDELFPGLRKIRMAITSKGRGKSGGARIITFTLFTDSISGVVYLIDIYDKADHSSVDIGVIKDTLKKLGFISL